MREDKGLERGTRPSTERLEWVKPELRRMSAGDAESGFPGNTEDAPLVLSS